MPLYSPGDNTVNMLLQKLQAAGRKVTALPGAAANVNGQVYYLGQNFRSDGTRWLSDKLYLGGIPRAAQPLPQATTFLDFPLPDDLETYGGYYVTGLALDMQPQTAQGAVFYTVALLYTTDGVNYNIVTPTANSTTAAMTVATNAYRLKPTLTPFVLPNTARNIAVRLTPTGAAGTFFITASLTCRLIGA